MTRPFRSVRSAVGNGTPCLGVSETVCERLGDLPWCDAPGAGVKSDTDCLTGLGVGVSETVCEWLGLSLPTITLGVVFGGLESVSELCPVLS